MSRRNGKPPIEIRLKKAIKAKDENLIKIYTDIIATRKQKQAIRRTKLRSKGKSTSTYINPLKLAIMRRNELLLNPTPSEIYFRGLLDIIAYKYEFQHVIFTDPSQFYILDFYLPEHRLCIELDGKHHYKDAAQIQHDKIRDESLKNLNIKTLRLPNSKALILLNNELRDLIDKI